jgi:hypothetical protein
VSICTVPETCSYVNIISVLLDVFAIFYIEGEGNWNSHKLGKAVGMRASLLSPQWKHYTKRTFYRKLILSTQALCMTFTLQLMLVILDMHSENM